MTGRRRFTVGLTGGIGCGKTTVADLFAELGVPIVDTDQIAHSLTAPRGPAMPAIVAEFGPEYAAQDGSLDRARMRQLVFTDPLAKARLEAILHPRIRASAEQAAAEANGPYVIMAVPLLIESGSWRARVDRVLAIDCSEETQVRRVMARSGITEAQVRAIMAAQVTRAQRLAAADDVIVNEGPIATLPAQVSFLHAQYVRFSAGNGTVENG